MKTGEKKNCASTAASLRSAGAASATPPGRQPELEAFIATRLVKPFAPNPHDPVWVHGSGVLEEPRDGLPAGTRFVEVMARTLDGCDMAERNLGEIAQRTKADWNTGWQLHDDSQHFRILVYPPEARAGDEAFALFSGA